jgi:pimeloyl-ACP methyl ester carboxylesterase
MKRLVVLVSSIGNTTVKFDPLLAKLRSEQQWGEGTQILRYEHRVRIWSHQRADDLAEDLAQMIQTSWLTDGPFDEIILMGNSLGGILVRAAYLRGLGSANNREEPQEWASHVTRIVLFAAFNRGIHLRSYERAVLFLLPWWTLLRDILIGSDFVTNVRLWWIRKLVTREVRPIVVQIRGTLDRRVERDDSLDVEGFLEGFQMTLEATHDNLLDFDADLAANEYKYAIFRQAILGDFTVRDHGKRFNDANQYICFLMHGIRASNDDWVQAMSTLIPLRIQNSIVIPPTYGRFSALQFLLPPLRRKKVRWFQDLYSSELAKNPLAKFHFIGHSYGTYLFGYGIRRLNGMSFERVSLNSSVLPAKWNWDKYRTHQVRELRNARAQKDVPVGILCSALRGVRMMDIGTAGYTGFQIPFDAHSESFFYPGGHSATVTGAAREDILSFLVDGCADSPSPRLLPEDQKFSRLSAGAWLLPPPFVLGYLAVAAFISWKVYILRYSAIGTDLVAAHSFSHILLLPLAVIFLIIASLLAGMIAVVLAWF